MTVEDLGSLGEAEDIADVLLEVLRYLAVPDGSGNGDRDRTTDRAPQIENSNCDGHVLMRYRGLHSDVAGGDDNGSSDTGENLRADEDGIGGLGSRQVDERDTTDQLSA